MVISLCYKRRNKKRPPRLWEAFGKIGNNKGLHRTEGFKILALGGSKKGTLTIPLTVETLKPVYAKKTAL